MNAIDDPLVDAGAQHHFNDVHGSLVGHSHAVDKFAADVQRSSSWPMRPASVNHDGIYPPAHQHHIAGKRLTGVVTIVATQFNDKRSSGEPLYVDDCVMTRAKYSASARQRHINQALNRITVFKKEAQDWASRLGLTCATPTVLATSPSSFPSTLR